MRGPRRYSKSELKRVGVSIIDETRIMLKCDQCDARWSPNLRTGGNLPRGYWKCPNRCNDTKTDDSWKDSSI